MGRHKTFNSLKGMKYFTKKEREMFQEEEKPLNEKEKVMTYFLNNFAIEVLEATGRGITVSNLHKAREILAELERTK